MISHLINEHSIDAAYRYSVERLQTKIKCDLISPKVRLINRFTRSSLVYITE